MEAALDAFLASEAGSALVANETSSLWLVHTGDDTSLFEVAYREVPAGEQCLKVFDGAHLKCRLIHYVRTRERVDVDRLWRCGAVREDPRAPGRQLVEVDVHVVEAISRPDTTPDGERFAPHTFDGSGGDPDVHLEFVNAVLTGALAPQRADDVTEFFAPTGGDTSFELVHEQSVSLAVGAGEHECNMHGFQCAFMAFGSTLFVCKATHKVHQCTPLTCDKRVHRRTGGGLVPCCVISGAYTLDEVYSEPPAAAQYVTPSARERIVGGKKRAPRASGGAQPPSRKRPRKQVAAVAVQPPKRQKPETRPRRRRQQQQQQQQNTTLEEPPLVAKRRSGRPPKRPVDPVTPGARRVQFIASVLRQTVWNPTKWQAEWVQNAQKLRCELERTIRASQTLSLFRLLPLVLRVTRDMLGYTPAPVSEPDAGPLRRIATVLDASMSDIHATEGTLTNPELVVFYVLTVLTALSSRSDPITCPVHALVPGLRLRAMPNGRKRVKWLPREDDIINRHIVARNKVELLSSLNTINDDVVV